jgi:dipeptidyl aminopeptidase/acylaminoacyl peptidase
MNRTILGLSLCLAAVCVHGAVPESILTDGVPQIPPGLSAEVSRYLELRTAAFNGWHPVNREVLITTRFADSMQLHLVRTPGGAREQLTFLPEPVARGSFRPTTGEFIVFLQDAGGGEFYQLYRFDLADARITLLTDGQSRNTNPRWARSGKWLAYTSTRRNGKDTDIYLMDPADPKTDRLVIQVVGGGWSVTDWSHDESKLLLQEFISINESRVHWVNLLTGAREQLTPKGPDKIAYGRAEFSKDDRCVFMTTDQDAEFRRLVRLDLTSREQLALTAHIPWDVEDFELSADGKIIALVTNEDGRSRLRLLNARSGRELSPPTLPLGVISGLQWHPNRQELAFTFSSARSPGDVYSLRLKDRRLERWTESECGGLNPRHFVEPELVRLRSFDGLAFSALVYRPDPARFPGKRPVLLNLHGGPEAQAQPDFLGRMNYLLNELGIALVYPNVRGSSGYGKTFLSLDNGYQREDSVRDAGAVIQWIKQDAALDGDRIGVIGGSYGGYMVLASLVHYSDSLRAGVDVVGISNFVTFLQNTQEYRRDLRRVEYGDERDPAMREFLQKISPTTNVRKIKKPLFVAQGQNDPRVPASESQQMVKAIREQGGSVWYLLAKDEGHGFAKKKNRDFQFLATILFLKEHLLP